MEKRAELSGGRSIGYLPTLILSTRSTEMGQIGRGENADQVCCWSNLFRRNARCHWKLRLEYRGGFEAIEEHGLLSDRCQQNLSDFPALGFHGYIVDAPSRMLLQLKLVRRILAGMSLPEHQRSGQLSYVSGAQYPQPLYNLLQVGSYS